MFSTGAFASKIARAGGLAVLFLSAAAGSVEAGGGRRHERDGNGPHRSQYRYIRDGLPPGFLPYTRQGLWGWGLRYPSYPLFHGPIPDGPGDCLYETGSLPCRRG